MTALDVDLLDALYAAPFEQDRWVDVLAMLADAVGGSSAWISSLDVATGAGQGITSRLDPDWIGAYRAYYHAFNPFVKALGAQPSPEAWRPGLYPEISLVSAEDLYRSKYFNEFMKPQGVDGTLIIRLSRSGNTTTALNINRSERKPEFTSADLQLVRAVEPHLQRAIIFSRKFASFSALHAGLATAMYDLPTIALVLDLNGRILSATRKGEIYLTQDGPLSVEGGRLTAKTAADAALLQAAIAAAASPERRGVSLILSKTGPRPAAVDVTPAPLEGAGVFGPPPSVLVTVGAAAEPPGDYQLFARSYGLTAAETRVAAAIASGRRLQQIADGMQLSRNTIRVHLAKIFEKTGVSRQVDLVRLMVERAAD